MFIRRIHTKENRIFPDHSQPADAPALFLHEFRMSNLYTIQKQILSQILQKFVTKTR